MATITVKDAAEIMDRAILQRMAWGSSEFGRYETFYRLSAFTDGDVMTRDMARALCRSLTDRGFCRYQRGLFNEDGEVAGAGYGLTPRGLRYLAALDEIHAPPA